MKRRQYLSGVGSITVAIPTISYRTTAINDSVSISIVETNDPVQAGGLLEVTVEIENASSSDIRPELQFIVGREPKPSTRIIPVRSGETDTVEFQHRTYPVLQDVTFPVGIAYEDGSDEQFVEVTGIDEINEQYVKPSNGITVQPETTIQFEVEELISDKRYDVHWFANNEYQQSSHGPWPAEYRESQGADYWLPHFESEGLHQITAVIDSDEDNLTTRWNVSVSSEGDAPPVVQERNPDRDNLSTNETHDLELNVASSDAELDRVIWWMHQTDNILGVSELTGSEDTASITEVGGCNTCPVIAWVINENHAVIEVTPWIFEDPVIENRVKEYDEGTLDEFEQELQAEGINVAYLEFVYVGLEGIERQIYFDYHTGASSEDELHDEVTVIAYEYASLIDAGHESDMLHAIFMDRYSVDLGGFNIYTDWAESYADGNMSWEEYIRRIFGELEYK